LRRKLKEIGWTKGRELAKLARGGRVSASSVHPGCKKPVLSLGRVHAGGRKEITSRETEPHEIIYLKIYKSQIPVIEQAIETTGLMLGTDKSRGPA
jgi:hypothetical protein